MFDQRVNFDICFFTFQYCFTLGFTSNMYENVSIYVFRSLNTAIKFKLSGLKGYVQYLLSRIHLEGNAVIKLSWNNHKARDHVLCFYKAFWRRFSLKRQHSWHIYVRVQLFLLVVPLIFFENISKHLSEVKLFKAVEAFTMATHFL